MPIKALNQQYSVLVGWDLKVKRLFLYYTKKNVCTEVWLENRKRRDTDIEGNILKWIGCILDSSGPEKIPVMGRTYYPV
jgi:hypothetical protein